jgi:hypothetical protein
MRTVRLFRERIQARNDALSVHKSAIILQCVVMRTQPLPVPPFQCLCVVRELIMQYRIQPSSGEGRECSLGTWKLHGGGGTTTHEYSSSNNNGYIIKIRGLLVNTISHHTSTLC